MRIRKLKLFIVFILLWGGMVAFAKKQPEKDHREVEVVDKVLAVAGADLIIGPTRVSKTTTWTLNFLSPIDLEIRKRNLVQELCRAVNADILINPQFSYSKRILGGGKLTVSGYPAKYNNFRSLTENEIDSIIIGKKYPEDTIYFINTDTLKSE